MNKKNVKITVFTGISIVVANMIGTGAFTSLGFQLESLSNTVTILSLWLLGGIVALAGAFSYAEVGTQIKKSGGEFTFLSRIYHPMIGYLSGWISQTVGFAAPIALSVIAFTQYFPIHIGYPRITGIALIAIITLIHCYNLKMSSTFQNISTLLKILFILLVVTLGLVLPAEKENAVHFDTSYWKEIGSAAFAVSLIYVSYFYSGWNAAAYITEEFRNPRKALPVALIGGTFIVAVLYTLLQFVFLKHASYVDLAGKLNVGTISMTHMLGSRGANVFSAAISLLLISGVSAMVWVGPRVTASIAGEYSFWRYFRADADGIPKRALWLQFLLSAILLLTGTFEQIMIYCGVLLNISTLLVVIGVFILRSKKRQDAASPAHSFRSPFFPFFQILFIAVSLWMIAFAFINNTKECLLGFSNLLLGLLTFFLCRKKQK